MNTRIKQLRKEKNMTQQAFADALGTSRNNIAGYEAGTRVPSDAAFNNICTTFNVNPEWLSTGEGNMFVELTKKDELLLWASKALSGEAETFRDRFVDALSKLDMNDWELLAKMAETLANQKQKD